MTILEATRCPRSVIGVQCLQLVRLEKSRISSKRQRDGRDGLSKLAVRCSNCYILLASAVWAGVPLALFSKACF
jgi:hypothetical protein